MPQDAQIAAMAAQLLSGMLVGRSLAAVEIRAREGKKSEVETAVKFARMLWAETERQNQQAAHEESNR